MNYDRFIDDGILDAVRAKDLQNQFTQDLRDSRHFSKNNSTPD